VVDAQRLPFEPAQNWLAGAETPKNFNVDVSSLRNLEVAHEKNKSR
jgi:hypothetical protein